MSAEGYLPFGDYRTWYRIVGETEADGRLPLVCLHGGPGATWDYLEPLGALATTGRRVIFYDQLGSGRSSLSAPHDPAMWTPKLFVSELTSLVDRLDLGRYHLLGQSWGGMLAMEYALTQPEGLQSLIIESSPASIPQWVSEANRLRAQLPADVQATLLEHEHANTTDDPEYQEAMLVFYGRHVCRVQPWPDCVARTFAELERNPEVYTTMNGPSEFHVVGTIRDWDITDHLGEIDVPALILSGRHDEATPAIAQTVRDGIRGSRWVVFENSSHMCHVEETELTLREIAGFLDDVESSVRAKGPHAEP